jgi:hypothetical protein
MLKKVKISCYVLPEEYHKNFIINFDEEQYNKVISEYYTK